MNKKAIIGLIVAIIVVVIAVFGYTMYRNVGVKNDANLGNNDTGSENLVAVNNTSVTPDENDAEDKENATTTSEARKTLVVYFSAQSHTKAVAEKVAENLEADIFEIVPVDKYTEDDLSYTDENARATREHEDESLQDIELVEDKVENWEEYDTVLIGYPIWWGVSAWAADSFVKANDFEGKTVIPFCTSASSGLGQSGKLLEEKANGGNWLEGKRFSSNASDAEIKTWTDSIK